MKNLKVKKALLALGAVMALGMAAQSHAQVAGGDANDLTAAAVADYAAADAELKLICAQPANVDVVGAEAAPAGYCTNDGRTYNAALTVATP